MKNRILLSAVPASACLFVSLFGGADWTRFRGEQAAGVADESDARAVPLTWSADKNVVWKTAMPGPGSSSPIVVGDRVFLTAYSGYGLSKAEPGEQSNLRHHLLCIDRAGGKILWDKTTKAQLPEVKYQGFMPLHGYASSTPTSDGQTVFAFFGRSGVYAYEINGKPLWHADVGSKTHGWGSAASPILYKDLLIVNASVESGLMVALDKRTGQERWKATDILKSWSTPLIVTLPDGKNELVVNTNNKIFGIDPATGEKLWTCDGVRDYVCPSVIAHEDVIFVSSGRRPLTLAVRCGGRGDVSETHLLWKLKQTSKVPTPLYHDGRLYWLNARMAASVDAKTGELIAKKRVEGLGIVYASMVMADGRLYAISRKNGAVVMAAEESMEELARNDLGDKSIFNGTPAIDGGQLLIRSDRYLYCIGE